MKEEHRKHRAAESEAGASKMDAPTILAAAFASWLIPGSGFFFFGRRARGAAQFALVTLTFSFGLMLHSSVAWPTWSIRSEEFNLINNFTFVVQMGSGAPAVASFWAALQEPRASSGGIIQWLGGIPKHPYYELGSYFLIVAGALNYFALGNFFDRIVRVKTRFEEQESAGRGRTP